MITNQPNLFLIGGMRCGSTALHLLLNQHDQINMSTIKEPYFYVAELYRLRLSANFRKEQELKLNNYVNWGKFRTRDKYNTLFNYTKKYKYYGEASHYIYHPDTANCIKRESPNSKIIISVRNPIDRLYSEYLYHCRKNKIKSLDFSQYVKVNTNLFNNNKRSKLYKGFYSDSILHWIKIFGEENVMVVVYEEFKDNQQKVLSEIYEWLNLPDSKIKNLIPQKTGKIRCEKLFYSINSSAFIKRYSKIIFSKYYRIKIRSIFYDILIRKKKKSDISILDKEKLLNIYREDIVALEKLLKKDLSFWLEI